MIAEKKTALPMLILRLLRDQGPMGLVEMTPALQKNNNSVSCAITSLLRMGYVRAVDPSLKRNRTYRFVCFPDGNRSGYQTRRELQATHGRARVAVQAIGLTPPPYHRGLTNWGRGFASA